MNVLEYTWKKDESLHGQSKKMNIASKIKNKIRVQAGFQGVWILTYAALVKALTTRVMNWNITGNRFVTGALKGFLSVPFFLIRNCPRELM